MNTHPTRSPVNAAPRHAWLASGLLHTSPLRDEALITEAEIAADLWFGRDEAIEQPQPQAVSPPAAPLFCQ